MTGAVGADPPPRPGWRSDVALSFVGAQRHYVEQVAQALQAWRVRCFYNDDEQLKLREKYLAENLPAIYGEQLAVVVPSTKCRGRVCCRWGGLGGGCGGG